MPVRRGEKAHEALFAQAWDLTAGLARRKEAREAAEHKKVTDDREKEKKKRDDEVEKRQALEKQKRDADKAFNELMRQESGKKASTKK